MAKINGTLVVTGLTTLNSVIANGPAIFNSSVLVPTPTIDFHASTKKYVDDSITTQGNTKVSKAGDTMSGFLTLVSNPTLDFHAATKQYVDMRTVGGAFDIHSYYPGIIPASTNLTRNPLARTVTFPINFAGSYAVCNAASTSSTTFIINQINGNVTTEIGQIIFLPGLTNGTFTSGTISTFLPGSIINIISPAVPDSTLSDVGIVLYGTRLD